MGHEDVAAVGPPAEQENRSAEDEAEEGDKDPVASHLGKKDKSVN